jgi:plastocyanin
MVDDYFIKNRSTNRIEGRTEKPRLVVISLIATMFILFSFVNVNLVVLNHRIEAATTTPANTTHQTALNSTATKTSTPQPPSASNTTKNKSSSNSTTPKPNTNSSTSQPNSNVSKLTTTQGNKTTNANAPGSPFPPKEANSTSYFPPTNKVAIVVGAALLRDKAYQPNPVNIKAGGVVTWNNEDTVVHTVTSGTGLQDPHLGNQFDSGLLGGHFSHIFFKAGVFPYFCQIHPTMVGKVIVK